MKSYLIVLLLCSAIFGYSQDDHPFVKLNEMVDGKKLLLVAKNTDSIAYSVFLRVETENYRRSGTRPTLITIQPNSETTLLSLVHIKGKPKTYEKIFVVNTLTHSLNIEKDFSDFYTKLNKKINAKDITLITSVDCDICNASKKILTDNNIPFKEINKTRDQLKYLRYSRSNKISHIKSPFIAEIDTQFYSEFMSVEDFIIALKSAWKQ